MLKNCRNGLTLISVSSLMLGATFLIEPEAAVAGGFIESCPDQRIYTAGSGNALRVLLVARCERYPGDPDPTFNVIDLRELIKREPRAGVELLQWTSLENRGSLRNWIGNIDGNNCTAVQYRVEPRSPGNPNLQWGALTANCGGYRTGLNTNEVFTNQNGVLDYDYIHGLGRQEPPPPVSPDWQLVPKEGLSGPNCISIPGPATSPVCK
jgi:hypothetical protein